MSLPTMKSWNAYKGIIFLLPFLALGLVTLSACDSDPGDDEDALNGVFELDRLEFVAPPLPNVNVLSDTLVQGQTVLRLFGGDNGFSLEYELEGDAAGGRRFDGSFTYDGERITLDFEGSSSDLNQLLLPGELTLQVEEDENLLQGSIRRTNVDLRRYNSARYGNVRTVDGTLEVRFRREGAAAGTDS